MAIVVREVYVTMLLEALGVPPVVDSRVRRAIEAVDNELVIRQHVIDDLRARVVALELDRGRLDWLGRGDTAENSYAMPVMDPWTRRWYVYHDDDAMDIEAESTLRKAIDAAMAREEAA